MVYQASRMDFPMRLSLYMGLAVVKQEGNKVDNNETKERVVYAGERKIQLICPVCGCKKFSERKTLMNTVGMTFMGFDWANLEAINYICKDCSYIYWFLKDPTMPPENEKPFTRAQQYEIEFEDTSSEMLYEILAGSDYNDDAKRAAKNVLRKRKMPV